MINSRSRPINLRSSVFGISLIAAGCSNTVQPDVVTSDVRTIDDTASESSLTLRDVVDSGSIEAEASRDDGPIEWDQPTIDVPSPPDDGGSLNDAGDGDSASDSGPCGPPGDIVALPGTNQSCSGVNGAPAEHCREVWQCGGLFTMGSPDAWIQPGQGRPWRLQNRCDISSGVVHPGFVDAYAVSVARFRAFVRAGMPTPPPNAVVFDREVWGMGYHAQNPGNAGCLGRSNPGPNDNLPVNCMDYPTAVAFCYWDGKHLATDSAWELVATNRGRTQRPFADDPRGNPCLFGDVLANQCKPMAPSQHFAIDAFPRGQTLNPPGVFGLWGGVYSLMHNSRVPGCAQPFRDGYNVNALDPFFFVVRGISAQEGGFEYDQMSLSRSTRADYDGGGFNHGIRCMRWLPESRG